MKKKIFLAVIAIFVICLTCGMLFVACNDKEGKEDEIIPDDETTKQEDVFKDVVYALQDVRDDTTGNKEFNFALDIVDLENDASVFTLATETIGGEDFFYGAIGSEMRKIKGFDLGGVIEEVLGWIGDSINAGILGDIVFDADGFLSGMIGGIAPSLLGDVAVSDNGEAYYLNLNILGVVEAIGGFGINFDTLIPAEYSWIIPTVVDVLGIDISTEGDKDPGLMDVLNFIASNYAINFYFGFGANADADKADTEDNKPFDNFEISNKVAAARKDLAAAGLISFQSEIKVDALNVTEDGGTAAEDVAASYVLDIDVDLDPFVLVRQHGDYEFGILSMLETSGTVAAGNFKIGFNDKTFKISDIMGMLDKAGYINISLDKVAKDNKVEKNLFTLYYDSRDGKVIASASVVNEVGLDGVVEMAPYSIGGVYDLDALATIIDMLINADKYKATGSDAAEGETEVKPCEDGKHVDADPADCKCDKCGTAIAHVDKEPLDNKCDVCGAHVHGDRNPVDGVCDTEGCNEHLHYDTNKDGICDTADCKHIMNVMTLITTIFNDVKNKENGFYALAYDEEEEEKLTSATVYFEKLANYVVKKFVTLPEKDEKWPLINEMIAKLPGQVLGGNALRVNIADISFEYGLAIAPKDYEAKSELRFNLREDDTFTGGKDQAYVSEITKIEGTEIKVGSEVNVTGKDFKGNDVVTTGKVMAIYDGNYYVGIYTDLEPNLGKIFAVLGQLITLEPGEEFKMGDNWPFYGVLTCPVPAAQA